jgi:hypothetical protein
MRKRVHELGIENSNYQNELSDLHKHFTKIEKILDSIDLK